MDSRFIVYKERARSLRKEGQSLRYIEDLLGVPRSTLNGWFRGIVLISNQRELLHKQWMNGLSKARVFAAISHTRAKRERILKASQEACGVFQRLDFKDISLLEMSLAIFYLAEGAKKSEELCFGNTDVDILRYFLYGLERVYKIDRNSVRCALHLRYDQDAVTVRNYWSKQLHIPLHRFTQLQFDKRTQGFPTRQGYWGVCSIRCGHVHIQRRLIFLGKMICQLPDSVTGS